MTPNSEELLQPNQAKSYLLHNYPNPTQGTTTIYYVLEDNANVAKIVIYNFTGSVVRVYSMLSNGKSALQINIGDFPSGMYSYALFVNGSKVDVKKLLLVK